jgi:hypothetical protein
MRPRKQPIPGVSAGQRRWITRTVNPSRKLRRFESFTRHIQYRRPLSALSRQGPISFCPARAPLPGTPCRLRCPTVVGEQILGSRWG